MSTSVRSTLTNPLGLPALRQLFFPEDRIVLVPDADYADKANVLLEIIQTFLEEGAAPQQLTLLLTDAEEKSAITSLSSRLPKGIRLHFHHPEKRQMLARLGVNTNNKPIMLCRELVDADLVLTIGRFRVRSVQSHFGIHSAVFPRFSDSETQRRFLSAGTSHRKLLAETEQVAALLGILFTIQFLHQKGQPLQMAAGLPQLVAETFYR